ncbi:hypothetical protein C0992_010412 [Termitomyces sp. T32_za158]|nr:hypothetical protein C0992_010412 [Termitomyces sp. T32_za158]
MLTLFKPWKSGLDLKLANKTWEESFSGFPFAPSHVTIMKNMNIRYECLDARDDFYSQRRGESEFLPMLEDDTYIDVEQYTNLENNIEYSPEDCGIDETLADTLGKKELAQQENMYQMKATLFESGWADPDFSKELNPLPVPSVERSMLGIH